MGFFSSLARKLINKSDDEAIDVISRAQSVPQKVRGMPMSVTPVLPPPRKIGNVGVAAAPPPATLPLPTRVPMADVGPPPGAAPPVPIPSRMPAEVEAAAAPAAPAYPGTIAPPNRIMVGESHADMSPTEQAATRLRVLQSAPSMSKVRDTGSEYEVEPPAKLSRLRGMWEGFKQRAPAGGQYGAGGVAGAGIVGALTGLIAPGSVQKFGRQQEIAGAEGQLARAQTLEGQGLQNEARRIQNMQNIAELGRAGETRDLEMDKELRVEWAQGLGNISEMQKAQAQLDPKSEQFAAAQRAIEQEAERLSRRTGRKVAVIPGNPKVNQLPKLQVDGQIVQQQYDGSWRPVFGTSKSAESDAEADLKANYEWQTKNAENEGKRTAAIQEATAFEQTAADHQTKVTTIATQISALDARMSSMSTRDPALAPLKEQRNQLEAQQKSEQEKMDSAYRRANEKKAEAAKFPALPPPPKRSRAANSPGVSLSESAWKRANPGKDWNLAVQEAGRRQIPIVP